jgi:DNA-binding HxlR family transcriptional regulator
MQFYYNVLDECCLARQALHLLADKWTVLVLYVVADGTKRYSEIHKNIGCITHKMLAQTLRRLERDGLLTRKVYAVIPPKTEYTLTALGETLIAPLNAFFQWGEENMSFVEQARTDYDARDMNNITDTVS